MAAVPVGARVEHEAAHLAATLLTTQYTGCWHLGAAEAGVRADEALLADVEAPQPQLAAALATLHLAHCQPGQLGGVARG